MARKTDRNQPEIGPLFYSIRTTGQPDESSNYVEVRIAGSAEDTSGVALAKWTVTVTRCSYTFGRLQTYTISTPGHQAEALDVLELVAPIMDAEPTGTNHDRRGDIARVVALLKEAGAVYCVQDNRTGKQTPAAEVLPPSWRLYTEDPEGHPSYAQVLAKVMAADDEDARGKIAQQFATATWGVERTALAEWAAAGLPIVREGIEAPNTREPDLTAY